MSTTVNTKFDLPWNKTALLKDASIYAVITAFALALFYGAMAGAAYMGMSAYVGLVVPIAVKFYVGWHRQSALQTLIGLAIISAIVTFLYFAPFGDAVAIMSAIGLTITLTATDMTKYVLEHPWRYRDFSKNGVR